MAKLHAPGITRGKCSTGRDNPTSHPSQRTMRSGLLLQPKHEDGARHEPAILCCHAPEPKPDQARPPDSPISVLVFGHAVTQGREREQGEVVGWPISRCEALVAWRHRRRARWESWGWGRRRNHDGFRVLPVRAWPDGTKCSRPAGGFRTAYHA